MLFLTLCTLSAKRTERARATCHSRYISLQNRPYTFVYLPRYSKSSDCPAGYCTLSPPKPSPSLMALKLYIHPCIHDPPGAFHPPDFDTPLRVRIQGPLETIQKLLPNVAWANFESFPQLGGIELARLTHQALYEQDGRNVADEPLCVQDEYLAWVKDSE